MAFRYGRRRFTNRRRLMWRSTKGRTGGSVYSLRRNVYTRSMLNKNVQVHMFKRFTQNVTNGVTASPVSGLTYTGGGGFAGYALQFKLSDMPNSAEFAALYDQISLTKVVIKFFPQRDKSETSNSVASGGASGGRFISAIDHDDSTAPAVNDLRQYSTCKITDFDKVHTRVITPAVLRQMFESNIATAYTPSFKQWISTTDLDTPHFGLKCGIIANTAAAVDNSIQYSIEATYYFKCKNVK